MPFCPCGRLWTWGYRNPFRECLPTTSTCVAGLRPATSSASTTQVSLSIVLRPIPNIRRFCSQAHRGSEQLHAAARRGSAKTPLSFAFGFCRWDLRGTSTSSTRDHRSVHPRRNLSGPYSVPFARTITHLHDDVKSYSIFSHVISTGLSSPSCVSMYATMKSGFSWPGSDSGDPRL
jgi:hypothetical protein